MCSLRCNMASSCRQRGLLREVSRTHLFPSLSLVVSAFTHHSVHRIVCATDSFPSLHHSMYIIDRATLMYATGRPRNVHFLSAWGNLSSSETGASAASNAAQGCCAHQKIYYLPYCFPSFTLGIYYCFLLHINL